MGGNKNSGHLGKIVLGDFPAGTILCPYDFLSSKTFTHLWVLFRLRRDPSQRSTAYLPICFYSQRDRFIHPIAVLSGQTKV